MLTIKKPDDWHLHLRDGKALETTVPHAAKHFARAIIMPNLASPIVSLAEAKAYLERIQAQAPNHFQPLMTLYLTETTTPEMIKSAHQSGLVKAVKWYPKGATTHSDKGLHDIQKQMETLECMSDLGMPLLIHGEVTDQNIDIFDREKVFIEKTLQPLTKQCSDLKIVLEHITSEAAVDFVLKAPGNMAATITAHHLWLNRNDLLAGGLKPHHYCLPILKRSTDQKALIQAATSGNPKFFLGTDSAPHAQHQKESACGCAGIYTSPIAMGLYTQVFEEQDALNHLEGFASVHGEAFYGLEPNSDKINLIKKPFTVPKHYNFEGENTLIPFMAGKTLNWQVEHEHV